MSFKNKFSRLLASLATSAGIIMGSVAPYAQAKKIYNVQGNDNIAIISGGKAPAHDFQTQPHNFEVSPFSAKMVVQKEPMRYAILVSTNTYQGEWARPVDILKAKYPKAQIFTFRKDMQETLPSLNSYMPTHVDYVARPEELDIPYLPRFSQDDTMKESVRKLSEAYAIGLKSGVGQFNDLLTRIDNDAYRDAIGGIITGATAVDALRLATAKPFTINNALLKTLGEDENLAAFLNVTAFSDGKSENGKVVKRVKQGKEMKKTLLDITGPEFFEMINTQFIDAVVVSCHASHRDWSMGWGYTDVRWVIGRDAALYAFAPDNLIRGVISSTHPKFYWGAGNCESARIVQGKQGIESIALSWIHSAGVVQHIGYTLDSWHGFIGWNLRHALLSSERPTIAEALTQTFIATEHEQQRLASYRRQHGLPLGDHEFGKMYDKAAVALYGSSALDVHLGSANSTPLFEKEMRMEKKGDAAVYFCFLKTTRDNTLIHAPVVYLLPHAYAKTRVVHSSPSLEYEIIDNAVIFETNDLVKEQVTGAPRLKPKILPKNTEWMLKIEAQ